MSETASATVEASATRTPGAGPGAGTGANGAAPTASRRVASAAGIMMVAILASRLLALVRDAVISYFFGASMVTDAYKTAFTLPDLFYYLIAGGALSSAFIPVFTEYLTRGDEENAWKVFSVFGTVISLGLCVLITLGEIFTPQLLAPMFPGFTPEKLELTVRLTRVIFPAQLFFFLGGLMMGTLQSRDKFLMPALGPVVYNVAIIVGGIIGGVALGPSQGIFGLAWGVLVGAFVGNVLMQIWTMRRVGVRYRPSFDVRHPGVVRTGQLLLPVLLGLSLPQLCSILQRPFASDLGDGPITWLDNSIKLMQIPLGIFAQGMSVAIFPTLSKLAAKEDWAGFRKQFSLGLRSILFLTIPSAVLIILLATPITALLFQRGKWTPNDTEATAAATVLFSFAIFAVSGQQIVNRGFYARQNTLTPMLLGTGATILFFVLNCALVGVPQFGKHEATLAVPFPTQMAKTNSLALSYTLSMIVYLAGLLYFFHRALGGFRGREILSSVWRITAASMAMGAVVWVCWQGVATVLGLHDLTHMKSLRVLLALAVCGGVGAASYVAGVKLLRVPEAEYVLGAVAGRFGRLLGRKRPARSSDGE